MSPTRSEAANVDESTKMEERYDMTAVTLVASATGILMQIHLVPIEEKTRDAKIVQRLEILDNRSEVLVAGTFAASANLSGGSTYSFQVDKTPDGDHSLLGLYRCRWLFADGSTLEEERKVVTRIEE